MCANWTHFECESSVESSVSFRRTRHTRMCSRYDDATARRSQRKPFRSIRRRIHYEKKKTVFFCPICRANWRCFFFAFLRNVLHVIYTEFQYVLPGSTREILVRFLLSSYFAVYSKINLILIITNTYISIIHAASVLTADVVPSSVNVRKVILSFKNFCVFFKYFFILWFDLHQNIGTYCFKQCALRSNYST